MELIGDEERVVMSGYKKKLFFNLRFLWFWIQENPYFAFLLEQLFSFSFKFFLATFSIILILKSWYYRVFSLNIMRNENLFNSRLK